MPQAALKSPPSELASAEEIIEEARNGRMFILVDDENRENEGDLIIPAQMATPESIAFMAKEGRGLICLAMEGVMIDRLALPMMGQQQSRMQTAFTISIEAREGVTVKHHGPLAQLRAHRPLRLAAVGDHEALADQRVEHHPARLESRLDARDGVLALGDPGGDDGRPVAAQVAQDGLPRRRAVVGKAHRRSAQRLRDVADDARLARGVNAIDDEQGM